MIFSVNPKPKLSEFVSLMKKTDRLLNSDALKRPKYYLTRGGSSLEDDVKNALEECAKGTPFANTIEKISGLSFPDIVAGKFYGVEVKSTKNNHWTSTGSSILESTRVINTERIYMTFGKLGGKPIEFLSRPYEECLSGIAVTHMPRYLIDMQLKKGESIFDKIGIEYDVLRKMDNPIAPVSKYYRSRLKKGESLWWLGGSADDVVSATMTLWRNLTPTKKKDCISFGLVNFPEVFGSNYDRYSLWLASQGIVNSNVRDGFSAGGQEEVQISSGRIERVPAIFRRVKECRDSIVEQIKNMDNEVLMQNWKTKLTLKDERFKIWREKVAHYSNIEFNLTLDILDRIFLSR